MGSVQPGWEVGSLSFGDLDGTERAETPRTWRAHLILRIVGLPVREEDEAELLRAFDDAFPLIRALPGCSHLALIGRRGGPDYLTLSVWESARALDEYRKSPLFARIWPRIRKTLRADPWAESYNFVAGDGPWGGEAAT